MVRIAISVKAQEWKPWEEGMTVHLNIYSVIHTTSDSDRWKFKIFSFAGEA